MPSNGRSSNFVGLLWRSLSTTDGWRITCFVRLAIISFGASLALHTQENNRKKVFDPQNDFEQVPFPIKEKFEH
jgi:hypothetical protein